MTINKRKILGLILFATMSFATQSFANCALPPTKHIISPPIKPSVPPCVSDEFMGRHNCDSLTISQYNSEVKTYNVKLEKFYDRLDIYVNDVNNYIRCMYRAVE